MVEVTDGDPTDDVLVGLVVDNREGAHTAKVNVEAGGVTRVYERLKGRCRLDNLDRRQGRIHKGHDTAVVCEGDGKAITVILSLEGICDGTYREGLTRAVQCNIAGNDRDRPRLERDLSVCG